MSGIPAKVNDEIKQAAVTKVRTFREKVRAFCLSCPDANLVGVAPGRVEPRCHHWAATCTQFAEFARAATVSEPYQIPAKQYYLGKNYVCTPDDLSGTLEVVDIFYVPVRKALLDEYVNHVVDRLRALQRPVTPFERDRLLFRVDDLEDLRRQIHSIIATEAGFEMWECTNEATAFKEALEGYLETRAKMFGVI